jgi:hypothetical protein
MIQDPHLKKRNLALLYVLLGLSVMLYFVAFVRVGGG